jgi:hypothetical protein
VKSSAKVFLSSAAFSIAVAVAYWFVSYEPVGTILLGLMGGAMLFAAAFTLRAAARHAPFPGDEPGGRPEDVAGETIGPVATKSIWPVVFACGVLVGLAGVLYGLWLLIPGLGIVVFASIGLMRETAAAPGGRV